eukprot:evm.model.scf_981.2 EVM.evm.TU.scf_981.2   scf_981:51275-53259(+)
MTAWDELGRQRLPEALPVSSSGSEDADDETLKIFEIGEFRRSLEENFEAVISGHDLEVEETMVRSPARPDSRAFGAGDEAGQAQLRACHLPADEGINARKRRCCGGEQHPECPSSTTARGHRVDGRSGGGLSGVPYAHLEGCGSILGVQDTAKESNHREGELHKTVTDVRTDFGSGIRGAVERFGGPISEEMKIREVRHLHPAPPGLASSDKSTLLKQKNNTSLVSEEFERAPSSHSAVTFDSLSKSVKGASGGNADGDHEIDKNTLPEKRKPQSVVEDGIVSVNSQLGEAGIADSTTAVVAHKESASTLEDTGSGKSLRHSALSSPRQPGGEVAPLDTGKAFEDLLDFLDLDEMILEAESGGLSENADDNSKFGDLVGGQNGALKGAKGGAHLRALYNF